VDAHLLSPQARRSQLVKEWLGAMTSSSFSSRVRATCFLILGRSRRNLFISLRGLSRVLLYVLVAQFTEGRPKRRAPTFSEDGSGDAPLVLGCLKQSRYLA
jgi:hypothetical protein